MSAWILVITVVMGLLGLHLLNGAIAWWSMRPYRRMKADIRRALGRR